VSALRRAAGVGLVVASLAAAASPARAADKPAATGETSFDRAVRQALRRERTARKVS